ncbi:MAG: hypothetical protein SFZ03_05180 [Candidatus Melainabacteria bacterium]|nr:hypothetical protein [Candidatus Melainabacteria bacterium]
MDRFSLDLRTLVETASILGCPQEDRTPIRNAQDLNLLAQIQQHSTLHLPNDIARPERFFFGCLDFLITRVAGQLRYSPMEMNGTGMAGVASVASPCFAEILNSLHAVGSLIKPTTANGALWPPVFLVPYSGSEKVQGSCSAPLRYERILYADRIRLGLEQHLDTDADIQTLPEIQAQAYFRPERPTVVLGHLKDLVRTMTFHDGQAWLMETPVTGSVHDQFCEVVCQRLQRQGQPFQFLSCNSLSPVTPDKGAFYATVNQLLAQQHFAYSAGPIGYFHAHSVSEMSHQIDEALKAGRKLVIKPAASGLGRGIDFFLEPKPLAAIQQQIEASMAAAVNFYGEPDTVFPYTVCDFIDSEMVPDPAHPQYGHKYECRVMVYREGRQIKACPSLVKIASQAYDHRVNDRLMLLNNVSASTAFTRQSGLDFVLPLTHPATLQTLGLSEALLAEMCSFSTTFVQFVLKTLEPTAEWSGNSSCYVPAN